MKKKILLLMAVATMGLTAKTMAQNICLTIGNDSLALLNNAYIIGPNSGGNNCPGLNVHTESKWIKVTGTDSLYINTAQHRFFDFSKIYDQSNNLIWSWLGESVPAITWYFRNFRVFVGGNDSVRIEFHQGFPDPFCVGYLQVVGIFCNAALPINTLQFTGKRVENTSELKWTTLSEQNNAYFEIEHSKDARNFTVVSDKINSKANNGNSNIALEYSFTDMIPNEGHNYYRLKQTDKDGKTSMAKNVLDVYFGNETMFTLFPNPAHNVINVNADNKLIGKFYTIYDNIGKVVKSGKLNAANTSIELSNLSSGFYMFSVGENKKQPFKIIKE